MGNDYRPWENVTVDNVESIIQQFDDYGGQELSQSIGRVIILWSQLDNALQSFLMEIMSIRLDHFLATSGQLDIYQKVDAILAITARTSPDERWAKHLQELKKYIHGNLREERNRLAHDLWLNEPDNKQSFRFKPSVDKATNAAKYITNRDFSNDELKILAAKVFLCFSLVMRLRNLYFPGKPAPWQQK